MSDFPEDVKILSVTGADGEPLEAMMLMSERFDMNQVFSEAAIEIIDLQEPEEPDFDLDHYPFPPISSYHPENDPVWMAKVTKEIQADVASKFSMDLSDELYAQMKEKCSGLFTDLPKNRLDAAQENEVSSNQNEMSHEIPTTSKALTEIMQKAADVEGPNDEKASGEIQEPPKESAHSSLPKDRPTEIPTTSGILKKIAIKHANQEVEPEEEADAPSKLMQLAELEMAQAEGRRVTRSMTKGNHHRQKGNPQKVIRVMKGKK